MGNVQKRLDRDKWDRGMCGGGMGSGVRGDGSEEDSAANSYSTVSENTKVLKKVVRFKERLGALGAVGETKEGVETKAPVAEKQTSKQTKKSRRF